MPVVKKHKVCFLAYARQYELANKVIKTIHEPDVEYILMECSLEDQEECVQEAVQAGCEVFIAGPGNSALFRNRYSYPIIEIPIRVIDYALAIRYALNKGCERIAVARFRDSPPVDKRELERLMDIELGEIAFEGERDLREQVERSDCDALIGTSLSWKVANEFGRLGVLLYLGTEGMRDACLYAAEAAREQFHSRREREITKAILHSNQLGILVTDQNGIVEMINRQAQEFIGYSSAQLRGKMLAEYFPNLSPDALLRSRQKKNDSYRVVDGVMMRCVQERILVRNEPVGVVMTLRPEAHNRQRESSRGRDINAHIYDWEELTAFSGSMKALVDRAKALTTTTYPTMIFGEPGSGHEEIAYCIHGGSERAQKPCITIDLATFSEQDAPRLLFGYDRGETRVDGLFVNAKGGSVILKNLPLAKPSVLACVMQLVTRRELFHLGIIGTLPDVRVFSAMTQEELYLLPPDLRRSLSIHTLEMPALRDRKEDIDKLFTQYVTRVSEFPLRLSLSPQMLELMQTYCWPGNIRELRAVSIRFASALAERGKRSSKNDYPLLLSAIGEEAFFRDLTAHDPVLMQRPISNGKAFRKSVERLKYFLRESNDVLAGRLGLSRTTLWRILKDSE